MEEKKTLKIKKPYLIIFALAIAFAIMGFIDLKVNAAELTTHTVVANSNEYRYKDGVLVDGYPQISDELILTSNEPIYAYYYTTFESPSSGDVIKNLEFISRSAITDSNGSSSASFAYNGETWYIYQFYQQTGFFSPYTGYFEFGITGAEKIYKLNQPYDFQNFITALNNGTLKFEEIIDYSQLQTDDNMPVISDILYNFIRNEKPNENDTTGLGWIKDVEYYDYLTWKNNANYCIQLEYCPVVQVFNGFTNLTFDKEYYGEWSDYEILESNTVDYTKRVDKEYLNEYEPYLYEYKSEIIDKYTNYGQYTHLFIGYRLRYVDSANLKAGAWTYLVPDKNGNYYSYSQYSDGSVSDNKDSAGTDNTYQNTDVEDAKNDIDKENEVKVEVGSSNSEIDIDGATNWLQSVASFIKGTPDFVGSVMSFLPEPIRYGMYVCLFLGVIASGYAIVKALI